MAERELLSELRRALAHLDDPLYLENLGLAHQLGLVAQSADVSRGQVLRRALRQAIATLDPGIDRSAGAIHARSFQILYRYAITRQSMREIAGQLHIGERQAYRDLHSATQALARLLGGLAPGSHTGDDTDVRDGLIRAAESPEGLQQSSEVARQYVDLAQILTGVVQSVRPLAQARGTRIDVLGVAGGPHVDADRVMLRQAILNLLSHILSSHAGDRVIVHLRHDEERATVGLTYCPGMSPDPLAPQGPYATAAQLLSVLGLEWSSCQEGVTTLVTLQLPISRGHTILIIEDNEGVVSLFTRYLRHQPYRVYSAHDFQQAIEQYGRVHPDVVILDVMLPNRDGWEVLQALRAAEGGRESRVIVCSIINDPNLATALGADAFLHKPVTRDSLVRAVHQVLSTAP